MVISKREEACTDDRRIRAGQSSEVYQQHTPPRAAGQRDHARHSLPGDPAERCRLVFAGDVEGGLAALMKILRRST